MSQDQENDLEYTEEHDSDYEKSGATRPKEQKEVKPAYKIGDKVEKKVKLPVLGIDGKPTGHTRSSYELFKVSDKRIPEKESYYVYQLKWKDRKGLTGQVYECDGKKWFSETSFDPA